MKAQEWAKENPDWNAYDPDKDEFLHPHLDSGWRKKKPRGKVAKNAATKYTPKSPPQQVARNDDDADTVRVIRKGMSQGYYTYDPLPKPAKEINKWVEGLREASRKKNELAPVVDWNTPFVHEHEKSEGQSVRYGLGVHVLILLDIRDTAQCTALQGTLRFRDRMLKED